MAALQLQNQQLHTMMTQMQASTRVRTSYPGCIESRAYWRHRHEIDRQTSNIQRRWIGPELERLEHRHVLVRYGVSPSICPCLQKVQQTDDPIGNHSVVGMQP
eukprot:1517709-Amphidinium_carterae.4